MPRTTKKPETEEHINPLLKDTRTGFAPAPGWTTPDLEEEEPEAPPIQPPTPQIPVAAPTQPTPQQTEEPPLLYKSQPSAEYLMRPYDRQRDKQALNADPYKIGAVEAICKLMRITKTDAFDEMMDMFLSKYADILESRPDVVRLAEQKYREKHHI